MTKRRLSVNIDHVATLRNARGGLTPDPYEAACRVVRLGAYSVTMHLREDRRHVQDHDLARVADDPNILLNFEMAATPEMIGKLSDLRPKAACLVPEERAERTTERGLMAKGDGALAEAVEEGNRLGVQMSLFVDAGRDGPDLAKRLGAEAVEFHTGPFCDALNECRFADAQKHYDDLVAACRYAASLGLEVHAGHGLDAQTARLMKKIPEIREMSIGFALMADAMLYGLDHAVTRMLDAVA